MLPSVGSVVASAPTHLAKVEVSITIVAFGTKKCWAVNSSYLGGGVLPVPLGAAV